MEELLSGETQIHRAGRKQLLSVRAQWFSQTPRWSCRQMSSASLTFTHQVLLLIPLSSISPVTSKYKLVQENNCNDDPNTKSEWFPFQYFHKLQHSVILHSKLILLQTQHLCIPSVYSQGWRHPPLTPSLQGDKQSQIPHLRGYHRRHPTGPSSD